MRHLRGSDNAAGGGANRVFISQNNVEGHPGGLLVSLVSLLTNPSFTTLWLVYPLAVSTHTSSSTAPTCRRVAFCCWGPAASCQATGSTRAQQQEKQQRKEKPRLSSSCHAVLLGC